MKKTVSKDVLEAVARLTWKLLPTSDPIIRENWIRSELEAEGYAVS